LTEPLFALDDRACDALARARGTPLFAYSRSRVEASYDRLRAALPARARIAYAVKANPHAALMACLAARGAAFDCASIGELDRVVALGQNNATIYFAGPGKRTVELQRALALGARIQAEGIEDLERIDALADQPVAVNLRVHPAFGMREERRILGGDGPSAFGIDEEQLEDVLARAARCKHVRIRGLHVFASSNQRDADVLLKNHARVLELGERLQSLLDAPLAEIDLGGGLGIPYAPGDSPLDLERLGRGLTDLLARASWFEGRLVLEPGRFLAGPAGVYLVRVVRIKESRGTTFAILEGGINHLARPLLTGEPFPVRAIGKTGGHQRYTLAGPLCTSLDRLGEVNLPALEVGDLLVFGQTGAYGFTEGMTHFLSHPIPPEVWVD